MTKQELIALFSNDHLVTGGDFDNLINSLKGVQSPVSDPAASGTSVTFIATITQDAEGKITVTKKTVNLSGYQTVAGMAVYQQNDLQQVGNITVGPGASQNINHRMRHYPTVRLIDASNTEVKPTEYTVTHVDIETLNIVLGTSLTGTYRYILD